MAASALPFQALIFNVDIKRCVLSPHPRVLQALNHVLSTGRAALRMAWKKGHLSVVPPFTLLSVGEQDPMGKPPTIAEAKVLLSEVPAHVFKLCAVLIGTLARPSAAMQLDRIQVDFDAGLVALNKIGRRQNKKFRPTVKLPGFLRAMIEEGEGPVVTYEGRAVKSVKTSWRQARKRAKLPASVTLYSWRHTLGRFCRSRGVPTDQLQVALGHLRLGVTERYAEYDPQYLKKLQRRLRSSGTW